MLSPSTVTQPTGRRILVNTGAAASSNLWRIAITFVLTLLIARKLGLEGLGQYTSALAYLNVCQVLCELGLPGLLVRDLAQTPSQRRGYFRIALTIQIIAGLAIWGVLVGLSLIFPWSSVAVKALWLVGASLPFYAITSVTQTFFQAGERIELVMGVEILINTLILVISVAWLWLGSGVAQLVGVMVWTQMISAVLGLFLLHRSRLLAGPQEPVAIRLRTLSHRLTPFYGLALADVLLQRIDILLLSVVGGATLIGVYSAAYNLVRVALKLVQSFWKALYPTLSRLHNQNRPQYARLANLSLYYTLLFLLPFTVLGAGAAQSLLHLVYGHSSALTGPVFQILIWSVPVFLIESYAVILFMVEQRPAQSLLITGLHVVTIALLLPLLTLVLQTTGAAWSAVLAGSVGALGSALLLRRLAMPIALPGIWKIFVATLAAGLVSFLLPLPWGIRLVSGGLLYVVIIWITGAVSLADRRAFRTALFGRPV
ncbi:flippase [soil metagenome]